MRRGAEGGEGRVTGGRTLTGLIYLWAVSGLLSYGMEIVPPRGMEIARLSGMYEAPPGRGGASSYVHPASGPDLSLGAGAGERSTIQYNDGSSAQRFYAGACVCLVCVNMGPKLTRPSITRGRPRGSIFRRRPIRGRPRGSMYGRPRGSMYYSRGGGQCKA